MKRIFAVDDSASIRMYMEKTLGSMGYEVELADDGDTALEKLRVHENPVDVFVIDVVMRNMDGITLIRHLREMEKFSATPVIVLTNLNDLSVVESARAAGASCWITKPFEARQIAEAIENLA